MSWGIKNYIHKTKKNYITFAAVSNGQIEQMEITLRINDADVMAMLSKYCPQPSITQQQPDRDAQTASPTLSAIETAKYLGVSLPTIRRWQQQGRLKYVQMGRRVVFMRNYLDDLLRDGTVKRYSHQN